MIVALNMSDVAKQRGFRLDRAALERALGVPVVETVAVKPGGERALVEAIDQYRFTEHQTHVETPPPATAADIEATQREVRRILDEIGYRGWIGCEYKPKTTTVEGLGWYAPHSVA